MAGLGRGLGALLSASSRNARAHGAEAPGSDLLARSLAAKHVTDTGNALKTVSEAAARTTAANTAVPVTEPDGHYIKDTKTASAAVLKSHVVKSKPAAAPAAITAAGDNPKAGAEVNYSPQVAQMQEELKAAPHQKEVAVEVVAAASSTSGSNSGDTAPAPGQEVSGARAGLTGGAVLKVAEDNLVHNIVLSNLHPSTYQPRNQFDDDSIRELAESIKLHGLLEPLIVKRCQNGCYEIICGERRYRAARLAGLKVVPCLVRDVVDEKAYAIALIENIQRENLNPMELAVAFDQMMRKCGMTQDEVAQHVGKSRSAIANFLRLLSLERSVQESLRSGEITLGHAKLIAGYTDETQMELRDLIIRQGLSVRGVEEYIKKQLFRDKRRKRLSKRDDLIPRFADYEDSLNLKLKGGRAKFIVGTAAHKGKLTLTYDNEEELNSILQLLGLVKHEEQSRTADWSSQAVSAAAQRQRHGQRQSTGTGTGKGAAGAVNSLTGTGVVRTVGAAETAERKTANTIQVPVKINGRSDSPDLSAHSLERQKSLNFKNRTSVVLSKPQQ